MPLRPSFCDHAMIFFVCTLALAVNEDCTPGCHARVFAKIADGPGDCDPVGPVAQSPWSAPSKCALRNRALSGTFLRGENDV